MDSVKHKRWTGVGNRRILQNLQVLAETGADIQIRIPLIKGVNADEQNIEDTASFVAALSGPGKRINLLPYHDVAQGKSSKLGMSYEAGSMSTPDSSDLERIVRQFASHGLTATIGG